MLTLIHKDIINKKNYLYSIIQYEFKLISIHSTYSKSINSILITSIFIKNNKINQIHLLITYGSGITNIHHHLNNHILLSLPIIRYAYINIISLTNLIRLIIINKIKIILKLTYQYNHLLLISIPLLNILN